MEIDQFEMLRVPTARFSAGVTGSSDQLAANSDALAQEPIAADMNITSDILRGLSDTGSLYVQELPPVDGGLQAWMFCASAFFIETMVWG